MSSDLIGSAIKLPVLFHFLTFRVVIAKKSFIMVSLLPVLLEFLGNMFSVNFFLSSPRELFITGGLRSLSVCTR